MPNKRVAKKILRPKKRTIARKNDEESALLLREEPFNEHHQAIFSLIRGQSQIDFSNYKLTTVNRRIQRQMKLHKIDGLAEYAEYLSTKPDAVRLLCDDIFIHVTEFFRDPESYAALKKQIFPRLTQNRELRGPLRIWTPGCSTGEEAYSIAISLLEYAAEQGRDIPFQIFATDISEQAVQEARAGSYRESDLSVITPAMRKKYFEKTKEGFRIKRSIRDMFVFSRHDLTSNPPFAKIDLISCRNVLIYFAPTLQRQVMPIFHYALNRDGILWLGKSESPVGISKLFSMIDSTHKLFAKVNIATPMTFRAPTLPHLSKDGKKTRHTPPPLDYQKEFDRVVISRYAPSGVVVNSELEILQLRGDNFPYLILGSGQPNYNLLKMMRPELLPGFRMAFQLALKKNASVRKEGLSYEFVNERRRVSIEVIPINLHLPPKERQYVILFDENGEPAKISKKPPAATKKKKISAHDDSYVAELLEEIDAMRDYQQSLAEGYEATQEELTSSNEELQSTLEELRSTNEELETAKEELQASNEELTTVNDELQSRNEELISAIEAQTRSEEKTRLLIAGVKDYAIIMLDPEGKVESWNEGAKRIKGYEEAEIIGEHFSKFYPPEDIRKGLPQQRLKIASEKGAFEEEGLRVRKDGSTFFAQVLITAIYDDKGNLRGFAKITRDITEKKNAERTLTQTEARYRQMIESIQDYAIFRLDPDGRVLTWNEAATRLNGYSTEEIVGKHFSIFYPEDLRSENFPQYELRTAAKDGRFEHEGWRIRKDGSRFWANVIITRIAGDNGELVGFTKVTRDLTERKKAEEARLEAERKSALLAQVQQSERTLDQIFTKAPTFMALTIGPEHVFERANQEYLNVLRLDSSIVGKKVKEIFPEIVEQGFIDRLDEVYRSGITYRAENAPLRLIEDDGSERLLYVSFAYQPIRNSEGQVYGLIHQGYDVTEAVLSRQRIERAKMAIENERENFRNLFRQTPEMVCILGGPQHTFEFVNEAHIRALGFDATGKTVLEAQPESTEVHGILDEVYRTGKTAELHEIPVTVTGRLRYFNLTYAARRDWERKIDGVMILGTEVTDQINAREKILEQAKSLESALLARDEFMSIASHELKTPLTSLKLQLQITARETNPKLNLTPDPKQLADSLSVSLRQVDSLNNLVEDLLDASRIRTGTFMLSIDAVNLADVTKDAFKSFSEQLAAAKCQVRLDLEPVRGHWDRHKLYQVFTNLISNAVKYAPMAPIDVTLRQEGDHARLAFADRGPGIPKAQQARIFDRFERANASRNVGGLGLGLFIVKTIVEAHQGSIHVDGDVGNGTTFIIELPLKPNVASEQERLP